MNEIQHIREKSSTKMMKYLLPPTEIGSGPPMSEWMISSGLDARDCGARLMCSFCFPARHGGHASFNPGVAAGRFLDIAISEANPDATSLTDCSFRWPNRRCQTLRGRGAVLLAELMAVSSWVALAALAALALRAKVLLSITRHCNLYIPPIRLHEDTMVPDLLIIWHSPFENDILYVEEVSLPTDSKLQPILGAYRTFSSLRA